jgi:hypothetical protein
MQYTRNLTCGDCRDLKQGVAIAGCGSMIGAIECSNL